MPKNGQVVQTHQGNCRAVHEMLARHGEREISTTTNANGTNCGSTGVSVGLRLGVKEKRGRIDGGETTEKLESVRK